MSTLGAECSKPQYGWTASAKPEGSVKLLRTTDLTNGPLNWESVPFCSDIPDDVSKYEVRTDDLFISRAGSVGVSVHLKSIDETSPAVFASYLIRIRALKNLLPQYLAHFLQSPFYWQQVRNLSAGATMANINAPKIQSIKIPVPPIEEQKRIVEALDSYLEKIDLTVSELNSDLRQLDELERSARFSEFERANSANAIAIVQIKDVTVKAKSIDPKTLGVDSFKYVDISSISTDLESPQILGPTETSKAPSRARQQLKEGDIVFSTVRPYQKKIALIKEDLNGQIASTGFCVLRPLGELVDSRYLYHYLKSDMLLDQVLPLQRGASYPAVGDTDVKQSTIPLPDLAIQQNIARNLDVVVGTVKALKSQLETTIERAQVLRRSLLYKAFSGQLNKEN
jgi:type I restriction enzyme S subunit